MLKELKQILASPRFRRWGKAIGLVLVALFGFGFAAIQWYSRDLPSMARLEMIEPPVRTQILAADSSIVWEFYEQNRVIVPLAKIPIHMRDAVLSSEDRRFYSHWGIDIWRTARAALTNLVGRRSRLQGGSTITQQLAKNLFLTHDQTLTRKIKEALLALKIERTYSKDEILGMYLNQVYFGEGAYGVEAASLKYFGKHIWELEPHQTTLLAGLPKNPRDYSPLDHPDRALRRRNLVLAMMVDNGKLVSEQADSLRTMDLDLYRGDERGRNFSAYFIEYVRQHLESNYGSQRLYRDGLTVYTSLDPYLQSVAEDSLESHLRGLEKQIRNVQTRQAYVESLQAGAEVKPVYLQGAVIVLEPSTGYVRAMVGGRNFQESKFNRAVQARRQPGSAFKPFVMMAAIENGYAPSDILMDTPVVIEIPGSGVYKPQNFSETFTGPVSLRYILQKSINVPTVKLIQKLGPLTVIQYAHRLGIRSPLANVLSLALGSSEVTLLEMTSAYGVMANQGIRAEPLAVLKVVDRNGNVLEERMPYREEVLPPTTAYVMTDMLRSVVEAGTGRTARAMGFRQPAGGKTGTTDGCTDGWFIGFTPKLACGVWVGFDAKRPMASYHTGARAALPVWTYVMQAGHEGEPQLEFPEPEGIAREIVCVESGLLSTPYCQELAREIFIEGFQPTRECDLHRVTAIDLMNRGKEFESVDKAIYDEDIDRR